MVWIDSGWYSHSLKLCDPVACNFKDNCHVKFNCGESVHSIRASPSGRTLVVHSAKNGLLLFDKIECMIRNRDFASYRSRSRLYRESDGAKQGELPGDHVFVDWSPDETTILSFDEKRAQIWDSLLPRSITWFAIDAAIWASPPALMAKLLNNSIRRRRNRPASPASHRPGD